MTGESSSDVPRRPLEPQPVISTHAMDNDGNKIYVSQARNSPYTRVTIVDTGGLVVSVLLTERQIHNLFGERA